MVFNISKCQHLIFKRLKWVRKPSYCASCQSGIWETYPCRFICVVGRKRVHHVCKMFIAVLNAHIHTSDLLFKWYLWKSARLAVSGLIIAMTCQPKFSWSIDEDSWPKTWAKPCFSCTWLEQGSTTEHCEKAEASQPSVVSVKHRTTTGSLYQPYPPHPWEPCDKSYPLRRWGCKDSLGKVRWPLLLPQLEKEDAEVSWFCSVFVSL